MEIQGVAAALVHLDADEIAVDLELDGMVAGRGLDPAQDVGEAPFARLVVLAGSRTCIRACQSRPG